MQIVFLPSRQIQEIQASAMWADREIRTDLARGFIRDEDDYTSNFTGALRRNINAYTQTGLQATSFLLSTSEERLSGTDATIILIRGNESKVSLFEAKWPRFGTANYAWDYAQTASGTSHFSDQLQRQQKFIGQFAVFEMFYCEHLLNSQPSFLQATGSSCTWHSDAEAFRSNRPSPDDIWSQQELQSMLTVNCLSIAEILGEVANCNVGTPIRMGNPEGIAAEFGLTGRVLAISSEA